MKPLAKYLNSKPEITHWIDGRPVTTIDTADLLEKGGRYQQLAKALRVIEAELGQGELPFWNGEKLEI